MIPWRRKRLPTPVFWPGEFHELYSPWDRKELDTTQCVFTVCVSLSLSSSLPTNPTHPPCPLDPTYPLSPTQLLPSFTPFQSRRSSLLAWKYVFTSPIFRIMLSKQNQNLLQAHVPFHLLLHIFFLNKIQHQNCLSLLSFFFKSNFSTSNFS